MGWRKPQGKTTTHELDWRVRSFDFLHQPSYIWLRGHRVAQEGSRLPKEGESIPGFQGAHCTEGESLCGGEESENPGRVRCWLNEAPQ
jgi:hypothetical protein